MKVATIIIILLLSVFSPVSSQNVPSNFCDYSQVIRRLKCGCFWAYVDDHTSRFFRRQCANTTGTPIRKSQASCQPYYIPRSRTYNIKKLFEDLRNSFDVCKGSFSNRPSSPKAAADTEIDELIYQLCVFFGCFN